ncbi:hypothetical protein SERLA73DRAFT_119947 [Serpula lacrymans var. lacrymans S7.3]|uniref:Uncharacterized protein n=1 Tax=Serpula lacrymans var. lacrymans (strain S7.3) TaxID=936435 RepID=F8PMU0_SERL3|nr:hypothetical protein SERLA73DRAFT_119947 [Serpula lacrymans var. lacrymans S7.3]
MWLRFASDILSHLACIFAWMANVDAGLLVRIHHTRKLPATIDQILEAWKLETRTLYDFNLVDSVFMTVTN